MKRLYRNLSLFSLSGLICLFFAMPANAQHHSGGGGGGFHGGGGGGGGFHGGGGGGFHGGGGGSFHGFSGGGHTAFQGGGSRSFAAPNRGGYSGRSFAAPNRGGYSGRTFAAPNRGGYSGRAFAAPNRNYSGHGFTGGRVGVNAYRGGFHGGAGFHAGIGVHRIYRDGYAIHGGFHGFGYRGPYGYYGYRGYGWHNWFHEGGFYYYHGFYGSLYWPRIGFAVDWLPYGYYPFWWGDYQYYYSNGYFYTYNNNEYTVVEPPVGAEVTSLPSNAQSIIINGQQFYEANGVYYTAVTKDDGTLVYQVAGKDGELNTDQSGQYAPDNGDEQYAPAPSDNYGQGSSAVPPGNDVTDRANVHIGDIVPNLPPDSRGVTVNGTRMFVTPDDVYYQATTDSNGNRAYKIVGLPSEAPQ